MGPLEVLVKLTATGLCHTDLILAAGHFGPCQPILGHEGIGRIVEIGSAVQANQGIGLGTRVGAGWLHDTCGSCQTCLGDKGKRHCSEQRNHGRHVNGTFADYVVINSAHVQVLPEGPADELLAPILCAGVTAYRALKESNAQAGQWVVLLGAGGGMGSLGVQYARVMGLRVIGVDGGKEKGEVVEEFGAEFYVDFMDGDPAKRVAEITEGAGGAAVVVFAGSGRAYNSAFEMAGSFSTVVAVGIPPPDDLLSLHPLQLIDKGVKMVGSLIGSREDLREAVAFVQRGLVKPKVDVRDMEELAAVAHKVHEGKVCHLPSQISSW